MINTAPPTAGIHARSAVSCEVDELDRIYPAEHPFEAATDRSATSPRRNRPSPNSMTEPCLTPPMPSMLTPLASAAIANPSIKTTPLERDKCLNRILLTNGRPRPIEIR